MKMLKCDPRAFARCPYRKECSDSPEHTSFYEGTECDYFNHQVIHAPLTNADRIRAMSDDDMADTMCRNPIFTVCDAVCEGDCKAVDTLNDTKEAVCKRTILDWLRQPAEED